jgi:hypothetical protein
MEQILAHSFAGGQNKERKQHSNIVVCLNEANTVHWFVIVGSPRLEFQGIPNQVPNIRPCIRVPLHHRHLGEHPFRPLVLPPPLIRLNEFSWDPTVGSLGCQSTS